MITKDQKKNIFQFEKWKYEKYIYKYFIAFSSLYYIDSI